jgi:hypothetical protein
VSAPRASNPAAASDRTSSSRVSSSSSTTRTRRERATPSDYRSSREEAITSCLRQLSEAMNRQHRSRKTARLTAACTRRARVAAREGSDYALTAAQPPEPLRQPSPAAESTAWHRRSAS